MKFLRLKKKPQSFIPVKTSDLSQLREDMHNAQGCVCPILDQIFPVSECVVDHMHRAKRTDPIGPRTGGLIRGVIHRQANTIEGKFVNAYRRYGLHKYMDEPQFLRNLADYLERKHTNYIHPNEVPNKAYRYIQLFSYKTLKEKMDAAGVKKGLPPFPRNKKLKFTIKMQQLFKRYKVIPKFYK